MHIDYNRQLELKHAILWNALNKYGIITPEVPPVIPSPILQHYRHRVEYTFSSKASTGMLQGETSPALGFHKNGEPGQVLDIHECFLQKEPSRAIGEFIKNYAVEHNLEFYDHTLKTGLLRSLSIRINGDNQVLVIIGFNEDKAHEREMLLESVLKRFPEIVSLNWTIHPSPVSSQLQGDIRTYGMTSPYFSELSGRYRFRIHPASFYQPNPPQADKIFQTIVEWAQLCGSEQIVDLYTGIGTIALYLAPFAKHVLGIEGSPVAIEDARENARMNDVFNAEFMTGDILKTFTADFLHRHGKPDVIVLDPPRSGTLIEIKKTINNSGANRVIYLSCNPVSLAFDLKQLCEVYRVVRIQPFDMLPQTHHLETLVLLERSSMQWQ
jgi:23S rRNA (uracil1939-C5)-methyltransferase